MSWSDVDELIAAAGRTPADVADLLADLRGIVARHADSVREAASAGLQVFPEIAMSDVLAGTVPPAASDAVRASGCAVVRGTFDRGEAEAWDAELARYVEVNAFRSRIEAANEAAATGSRIWGVYWSRPQVLARQHARMVAVRRFLNGFWRHESAGTVWFDPARDIGYPDRVRRREPGAISRGLACHGDGVAVGGWRFAENQRVYAPLLARGAGALDPWDAAHRTLVGEPSVVGPTVFRTFQGWTALSEMHPSDGVLHVSPILPAVAYRYVAGIAGELGHTADGATPGPAPRRDAGDDLVRSALVPIPAVEPGDTVWWHGDLFHSVADAGNRTRWGNVMYIGSSPVCERNDAYRSDLFERFESGRSPHDFPPDDLEVGAVGRAATSDLDATGRAQFGI